MAKRVDRWESEDGRFWDTEEEALAHEDKRDRERRLERLLEEEGPDDAVAFILEYWDEIKAIMEPAPRWSDVGDAIGLTLHKIDVPTAAAIGFGPELDLAIKRITGVMAVLEGFGFKFEKVAGKPVAVRGTARDAFGLGDA